MKVDVIATWTLGYEIEKASLTETETEEIRVAWEEEINDNPDRFVIRAKLAMITVGVEGK